MPRQLCVAFIVCKLLFNNPSTHPWLKLMFHDFEVGDIFLTDRYSIRKARRISYVISVVVHVAVSRRTPAVLGGSDVRIKTERRGRTRPS